MYKYINVKGIFVPDGIDSYIIVSPKTYENVVGFKPVTFKELYGLKFFEDTPINANEIFTDKVNLYTYELIYNDLIEFNSTQKIILMLDKLEKINKVSNIDFNIHVVNCY